MGMIIGAGMIGGGIALVRRTGIFSRLFGGFVVLIGIAAISLSAMVELKKQGMI